MNPDRWQQIKTILDAAADRPAGDRRDVLDEACGEDQELRQDVEAFLDLDEEIEEFIEEPLWSLNPRAEEGEEDSGTWGVGRRVGPYRIERSIGRGGMGTVFLAVREDDYEQKVALKVLSWGMSSEEVLGRFYNERQILANLQHPSIARLLDGGTTDDGLPFLVMEYVEGERIDHYCESRDLPVRERLRLFQQVCAAVQFAHQNLIVHRDLKASNILVNDEGRVRLLDFGIAKILEPHLAFQKVATLPGQAPMTPAYASPEQVLNDPITTACDVYALGVLLYRLLTGSPPYRLEGTSYPEMVHVICYQEPERPSTVVRFDLSAVQEQEESDEDGKPHTATQTMSAGQLRVLGRKIAGDLDAIVLKAMRKEPEHRYGSAAELADDIERHLVGLPVQARKGNWFYFTSKFLRRNKLALAAIVAILAFAITATVLWRTAVDERAVAEAQRARAESQEVRAVAVREFLKSLLQEADPDAGEGAELTAQQILARGRDRITSDRDTALEDKAEIIDTLVEVYAQWGRYEEVIELARIGLEARRTSDPSDRPELANAINNLARGFYGLGDYAEAEPIFLEAISMWKRLGQVDRAVATATFNLGATLRSLGRYEESRGLYREALDLHTQLEGPEGRSVASTLYGLGVLYSDLGDFEGAERALKEALRIRVQQYDSEHTSVAAVSNSLGRLLHVKGDLREARNLLEKALEIRAGRFGEDEPQTIATKKYLAFLLLDLGEIDAAGELIEQTQRLEGAESVSDQASAQSDGLWGRYLQALGRCEEAEPFVIESFQFIRERFGDLSLRTRRARQRVLQFGEDCGKPEVAARYLSESPKTQRGS